MDTNVTLLELLFNLQLATQTGKKEAFQLFLNEASTNIANMRDWVEKGGFLPTETFSFEMVSNHPYLDKAAQTILNNA